MGAAKRSEVRGRRVAIGLAVHRRLAVVLGLWIVFQGLTGVVLLFRDPIEHWTAPGLTRHGRGDRGAAAALDAVRRRYPSEAVGVLATPEVSDGVYVIEVGERDVYVDPAQARINGARDPEAGFVALVARLHRRLLFDSLFGLSGARLVAGLAVGALALGLAGLAAAATGRRVAPVRHRRIGTVVAIPLAVVALTGIRLAVPAGSDRLWAAVTGSGQGRSDIPPAKVAVGSKDQGGVPLDATEVLRALRRKYPDTPVARLLMPRPGDRTAPVIAGLSLGLDPGRGQHDYGGNTVVFLDQYSGDTLWEGRPDSLPAARQVAVLWSRPLHTGSFAGPVGQLLWGWLGLALVALGVSGYTTRRARLDAARLEKQRWRRRRRRRRTLARRLRARRVQAARERRRAGRRLRRRRTVQARLGRLTGAAATETDVREAAEVDLTDDTLEIDLTDSAGEIDLRDDSDVRRG